MIRQMDDELEATVERKFITVIPTALAVDLGTDLLVGHH